MAEYPGGPLSTGLSRGIPELHRRLNSIEEDKSSHVKNNKQNCPEGLPVLRGLPGRVECEGRARSQDAREGIS